MQLHDPLQVFLIRAISAAAAVAVVSKWWDETEAQRSASPCFFNYFIYYGISTRATDKKVQLLQRSRAEISTQKNHLRSCRNHVVFKKRNMKQSGSISGDAGQMGKLISTNKPAYVAEVKFNELKRLIDLPLSLKSCSNI